MSAFKLAFIPCTLWPYLIRHSRKHSCKFQRHSRTKLLRSVALSLFSPALVRLLRRRLHIPENADHSGVKKARCAGGQKRRLSNPSFCELHGSWNASASTRLSPRVCCKLLSGFRQLFRHRTFLKRVAPTINLLFTLFFKHWFICLIIMNALWIRRYRND